ncbi:Poly(3-hydroxyoctanoate) depolymerase [Pontiella desulfatans]|uniref:Poly(3-hydroxyoctanoate) depolymerase n=1 Tax=Pontiella desulfatans TaxID=2750659 RepID=A0A6C2TXZ3_PONDE|nr:prolyl oligopeptidase family serine peptidase [Pontiella desulfatans]VGO12598.1 Poly(3-hydroxyoctanoate) depolymerase [Pontiella desulfatans]
MIHRTAAALTISLTLSGCISLAGQQTEKLSTTIQLKAELDYLLHVPEEVPTSGKKWPLMLFLHGAGERGSDLELVKRNGPPMLIAKGREFPFIIASPQCSKDIEWSHPEKIIALNALIDELVANYPVDESRIYLTGLSMGGFGTWALAASYPDRFAAIAPVCGGGCRMVARRLVDMPIWVFHGAKDKVVPISMSQEMVDALEKKGSTSVKFTIYPETGHNSWVEAYNTPELYKWFLSHAKEGE